jgi:hypothetical protein
MVAFARAHRAAAPDPFERHPEAQDDGRAVQRRPVERKPRELSDEEAEAEVEKRPDPGMAVSHWADQGVADAGQPLPHLALLSRAFGPMHDLSGVRAHQGGAATAAAEGIDAQAYAIGNHVAFNGQPDLHTVAHEAAHAVQQGAGQVARPGEEHEQQADAVAERVVAGRSAADLLPGTPTQAAGAGSREVQRKGKPDALDIADLREEGSEVELNKKQLQAAVQFNNKRWTGKMREQLLGFLRGTGGDEKGAFTAEDVQMVAEIQQGGGAKPDGMIGDSTMALLLNSGFEFEDDVLKDAKHPSGKPRASEVVIEFWPGELEDMGKWDHAIKDAERKSVEKGDATPYRHLNAPGGEGRLYIKVGGKLVAQYRARGGPPRKIKDFDGHTADPTQGSYTLGGQQKGFTTKSWNNSQIPWGADIREGRDGGYEYRQDGTSAWKRDPTGLDAADYAALPDQDGDGTKDWNKNDFGDSAWRLQGSPGFLVHTTPETEEAAAVGDEVELTISHGCIHIDPNERDEMMARGFLQKGVRFVCKKYTDKLVPAKAREQLMQQYEHDQ